MLKKQKKHDQIITDIPHFLRWQLCNAVKYFCMLFPYFFQEFHIKEVIVYASSVKHIVYCFVAPSRMGQIKCNTASIAMILIIFCILFYQRSRSSKWVGRLQLSRRDLTDRRVTLGWWAVLRRSRSYRRRYRTETGVKQEDEWRVNHVTGERNGWRRQRKRESQ